MSVGVRMVVSALAYGIVGWLVILGLAAGDPWMVGLSMGWFLPVIPRTWQKWGLPVFCGYVVVAGFLGPAWAWMGVLLLVPVYLDTPRPGLVFGAAMILVLSAMSVQQQGEIREREERLRELLVESGDLR
jgi:hypothetical protein